MEINIKDYDEQQMKQLAATYTAEKILSIAEYAHSYVACIGDLIVGCGSIANYWGKQDESILLTFFVLPEYHGQGIGRAMICTLEQDEFFLKAKRIEVPASITASVFYEKMGYAYKSGTKALDEEGLYRMEKAQSGQTS